MSFKRQIGSCPPRVGATAGRPTYDETVILACLCLTLGVRRMPLPLRNKKQ